MFRFSMQRRQSRQHFESSLLRFNREIKLTKLSNSNRFIDRIKLYIDN